MQMDATSAATVAACAAGTAAAVGLLVHSVAKKRQHQLKIIPSVGSYPLVGSHFHLREPWYLDLYERFSHHPLICVHFGLCSVKVFNEWHLFKEAMVDNADSFAGRVQQGGIERIFGDRGGIASTDGNLWREYRRFSLKVLRDCGFGRKEGEEMISVEADHLARFINDTNGAAIETSALLSKTVSNIICQLVFGSRLASEDPNFDKFLKIFQNITQSQDSRVTQSITLSTRPVMSRFPQLIHLLTKLPVAAKGIDNFRYLVDFSMQHKQRIEAEMQDIHNATNYIEAHILHQRDNPEMYNDIRLAMAVAELFIAGTDTTSHTLCWAILYMIRHPQIAEKVHEEIMNCMGLERLPTMKDKTQLNYTQAVMEEVFRCSSLVAMGLFHRVTEDVQVGQYKLHKNEVCLFNVYAMHYDKKIFPNPKEFLPERHLQDGKFVPCDKLCTFGIGRRACLGESLARMEFFIFFVTLMQRYRFSLDPEEKRTVWQLTEDKNCMSIGILRAPPAHKIVFTPR